MAIVTKHTYHVVIDRDDSDINHDPAGLVDLQSATRRVLGRAIEMGNATNGCLTGTGRFGMQVTSWCKTRGQIQAIQGFDTNQDTP